MIRSLTRHVLPVLEWLPGYRWRDARSDLLAGLTVGIMLIPQAMAYAVLAGLPPVYGLYASIVPLLAYTLLGTSRRLAVGPVAIDSLIMAVGLGALAEAGSAAYTELAFVLALMVGAIHLTLGLARFGFMADLLSRPVVVGFTSAAALIIAASQLGNLLGLDLPRTEYIYDLLWATATDLEEVHLPSLAVGGIGILVLVGLRRWKPLFPASLLAVVVATFVVWKFELAAVGVEVVGEVPGGLPAPTLPTADLTLVRELIPTAVTLALLQFTNVIALGKALNARHGTVIVPNQEFVALGAMNVLGSLFRSLPVSGSFARTVVNEQAGARSPMANAFAAGLVVLTVVALMPLFHFLPIPILAALIMVAAFAMVDVEEIRTIYGMKPIDGTIAAMTFLLTLLAGLQIGILVGVAASVMAIMYRISRPHVAELGHLPGTRSFRDMDVHSGARPIEGVLLLRVDASFSYANADYLRALILDRADPDQGIHAVVLDASTVNDLDTTAVEALENIARTLNERQVEFYLTGVHGTVRGVLDRSGLRLLLGDDHILLSPHRAVTHILRDWNRADAYLSRIPTTADPEEDPEDRG